MIRYGPAGWDYKDWAGIVYPDPKPRGFDPLHYLAHYFSTIEVNSTFYRPLSAKVAGAWLKRVEFRESFRFTAKLWKRFTHERAEAWTRDDEKAAREGFDLLHREGKLGAVLLQFPWSFRATDENREWLTDLTDAFAKYPLVLEVRHASWNTAPFYEQLVSRGIGFVNIDQPLFKNSIKPSAKATSSVGYVRVHGRNYKDWFRQKAGRDARYDYLYSAAELEKWADRVKGIDASPGVRDVYVVTNNHFRGKAPANALMMEALIEGHPVTSPPELVAAYPKELGPYARSAKEGAREEGASPLERD